jgi:cyclase
MTPASRNQAAAAVLLFGLAVLAPAAAGRQAPAPAQNSTAPPLSLQKITEGLYLVKGGSGANAAFYVGPDAVVVVDAKMSSDSARAMLAEIGKVTTVPVTTLVLTHSDGDHINGLPGFPKGLTIVAQENCRAEVEATAAAAPELEPYLPNKTYSDVLKVGDGASALELRHYGPAHTEGDTVVYFPDGKTAFLGDLIFVGRDPLIHRAKGGSSFGYVATLRAVLARRPAVETFLSGHADPVTRAGVESLASSIEEKQARVKALVAEGKSLAEVKAAFGLPDAGQGGRRFPSLVEVIYLELTEKT